MAKPFALKNEMIFVLAEAPGGLYNPEQLLGIAQLCDRENLVVKTTEDQRLGIMITEAQRPAIAEALAAFGLGLRDYQSGLHQAVSCLGNHCPMAQQDALATATALTKDLGDIELANTFKLGVNGCANCCVPTHTLDVSLIGEDNGYRVSLGGKTSQIPEMASFIAEAVPAAEVSGLIRKAIDAYKAAMQDEESLQDVMQRVGATPFVEAFAPYSQDAAGQGDPFAVAAEEPVELNDTPVTEEILETTEPSEEANMKHDESSDMLDEVTLDNLLPEAELDIAPDQSASVELKDDVMISAEPLEFTEADLAPLENESAAQPEEKLVLSEDSGSESEQQLLEDRLEGSIAEQAALGELPVDENTADRDSALASMEDTADPAVNAEAEIARLAESFSDPDSHSEEISELQIDEPISEEPLAEIEHDDALEDHNVSRIHGESQLGYVEGLKVNEEFLTLLFAQGAVVNIDIGWLRDRGGRRNFSINGQVVSVRLTPQGLRVNVDGVEIQLPEISLAA